MPGSSLLWEAFAARTLGLGDAVAVEAPSGGLRFAELWRTAEHLAAGFRAAGVPESGVAGLSLGNSALFPAAFLALCRLDATVALADSISIPVIASGGLASIEDIKAMLSPRAAKLAGAIAGRALYDGRLDAAEALNLIRAAKASV